MQIDPLRQLADRFVSDSRFREALRVDADGAVREAGVRLSAAELAAVRAADWTLSESQLHQRLIVAVGC